MDTWVSQGCIKLHCSGKNQLISSVCKHVYIYIYMCHWRSDLLKGFAFEIETLSFFALKNILSKTWPSIIHASRKRPHCWIRILIIWWAKVCFWPASHKILEANDNEEARSSQWHSSAKTATLLQVQIPLPSWQRALFSAPALNNQQSLWRLSFCRSWWALLLPCSFGSYSRQSIINQYPLKTLHTSHLQY